MYIRSVRINIANSTKIEKSELENFLVSLNENISCDFYDFHVSIRYSEAFQEWASYSNGKHSDMTISEFITKFSRPKIKFII